MFAHNIFAIGALVTLAAAVPLQNHHEHLHLHQHEKREVVWTTSVVEEFVTVPVTTTVFGAPPGAGSNLQHGQPGGFGPRPTRTSHIFQTITVQPQPAPPAGTQPPAPDAAPPSSPSQPAAPDAAPPSAPSQPVAPAPPSAPPAQPSAAPPAPAPMPSAQPQPAPQPSPSSSPSPPSGGGSGGGPFTGDITYYTPGLGSCGQTNTESDSIVALAQGMMTEAMTAANIANPNENPLCGKSITITYNGVSAQATITDTCPGCSGASLDLTPSLFEKFGSLGEGRISGVSWNYN